MKRTFKIGTRSSPLAMWQAQHVASKLADAAATLGFDCAFELVPTQSAGDKIQEVALADLGGKGLFAKDIETDLQSGVLDLGVHSLKDMETHLPDGLVLAAVTEREDPRDFLVCRTAKSLSELPKGAVLGTASARRKAQALSVRPDLDIQLIRGNVGTRLKKIEDGQYDATILAAAGLTRLELLDSLVAQKLCHPQSIDTLLPAVAQGIVAIEIAQSVWEGKSELVPLLNTINNDDAWFAAQMERSVLSALDGSCKSSIAVHCQVVEDRFSLKSCVYAPDGTEQIEAQIEGVKRKSAAISIELEKAQAMGKTLADKAQHLLVV